MTATHQITFVCCVESGYLEIQTIRMIESLRRWGGRFANAPIIAVTPRFGSPLAEQTYQCFQKFQVEYVRFNAKSYTWNKFMNKPYALVAAHERSQTEFMGWLDSDLLFLAEPNQFMLNDEEDFLACAVGKSIASTGSGDSQEPYWQEICHLFGLDIEAIPWITTEREQKRIRLYWNSGVFIYRRSRNFAHYFLEVCIQLMNAHIANHESGIFFNDQVALVVTMIKMELSWRKLPYSHNYSLSSKSFDQFYREGQLKTARVFHYHNLMSPPHWSKLINSLRATHPPVADWLSSVGSIQQKSPFHWRVTNKIIKFLRSQQESRYKKSCRFI